MHLCLRTHLLPTWQIIAIRPPKLNGLRVFINICIAKNKSKIFYTLKRMYRQRQSDLNANDSGTDREEAATNYENDRPIRT